MRANNRFLLFTYLPLRISEKILPLCLKKLRHGANAELRIQKSIRKMRKRLIRILLKSPCQGDIKNFVKYGAYKKNEVLSEKKTIRIAVFEPDFTGQGTQQRLFSLIFSDRNHKDWPILASLYGPEP